MLGKLLIAVVVALVPVDAALAQGNERALLMPGVSYTRDVEFTPRGPVVLHVINAPRPGGLYSLLPLLSNNAILGHETLTSMQRDYSATATVAGVNGDLSDREGQPVGIVIRDGVLEHAPARERASVGVTADGALRVERVAHSGFWKGTGQRRALTLNALPTPNGVSIYTPSWGPTTPRTEGVEAVVRPVATIRPNGDVVGTVVQIGGTSGGTAVPPDGAVLQARGSGAARLAAEAPVGTQVTVRFTLNPGWTDVPNALGGGPLIVRDGKPVFRANEAFAATQLTLRSGRTAVGQRADGRVLLVAVDGQQPGYSVGMTNFELALALMRLGAVTASALDSGGSTTMAFDGELLSRPSDRGGERAIANALVVAYTGVYAAPPAAEVLSPNGDGVADAQSLAYKVVRPSAVQATLVAPDRTTRALETVQRQPGTYRLTWPGTNEAEGQWRFSVSATDDRGQTSTADRLFSLNRTLGSLSVRPETVRVGRSVLSGSVELAHAAQVSVTIETATNIVLRVVARRRVEPGSVAFSWNGRDSAGRLVHAGRFQVHVVATNDLGRAELRAPFTARR